MSETALDHQLGRGAFLWRKAQRHWHQARTRGVRSLIEEDRLDPVGRARRAAARALDDRRAGRRPGGARVALVAGLQRSGTNMVERALDSHPAVTVHFENSRAAYERFRLRDPDTLEALVGRSRSELVVFKALTDAHLVNELRDHFAAREPRVVWMWRGVDGRVASAMDKWPGYATRVLSAIVDGSDQGSWQAEGLTPAQRELVAEMDPASLDDASNGALIWYLRNALYFDLGLDDDPAVRLVAYEDLLAEPREGLAGVCDHLGLDLVEAMMADLSPRRPGDLRLDIDPRVRALTDELTARLRSR